MKDKGFREVFGFDKLGLKQINDTLRALLYSRRIMAEAIRRGNALKLLG